MTTSELTEDPHSIEKGRETLRTLTQHEDDLRDQRLGYLLTLNGLLFAALGFAWDAKNAKPLVVVLACMGIVIAFIALLAMILSDSAIRYWRDLDKGRARPDQIPIAYSKKRIREEKKRQGQGPQIQGAQGSQPEEAQAPLPEIIWWRIVDAFRWLLGLWHALPLVLGAAWTAILVIAIRSPHWR